MSAKIKYGLLGRNIAYSFSRGYFAQKFADLGLDAVYENYDVPNLQNLRQIFETPGLKGLNVTIPYKEAVIEHLTRLSGAAKKIGAVNTISFESDGPVGHNTDYIGFSKSLAPHLKDIHKKALILGHGGAAKAVAYALETLGIGHEYVTRSGDGLRYADLTTQMIAERKIVINTTPLGTFPQTDACPEIPYEGFSSHHIAFDLIYNPPQTEFLNRAGARGATILNGYEMLVGQAEAAWSIWQGE